MTNLSNSATQIQNGAEGEAKNLGLFSGEMESQYEEITKIESWDTRISQEVIWKLIVQHLNDTITDCNTLLSQIDPQNKKQYIQSKVEEEVEL